MRVGAQAGQPQVWQLQHGRDGFHGLLGRHAEPFEPDVDLHEHVARSRGRFRIRTRAVEVDERRSEAVGDRLRRGLGQRVRIDEDGCRDPAAAQADALPEVGDAERIGAIRDEDGAQLGGAVTVAVGLDHREDFPLGAHHQAHGADVRGGGVEVDLEGGRPRQAHLKNMPRRSIFLKP